MEQGGVNTQMFLAAQLQQQQRQIQQLMNMLPHFQNQPLNMTLGMMSGRLGPDAATIIPTSLSQTNLAPTDPLSTTATSNPTNIGPTSSGPANVAPVASEPSIHGPVDSGQATNYRATNLGPAHQIPADHDAEPAVGQNIGDQFHTRKKVSESKNPSLVWKRLKHKWIKSTEEIIELGETPGFSMLVDPHEMQVHLIGDAGTINKLVALAPPPPPGMLTCPECGKFYKNANSLRVHKLKYHRHDFIQ